MSSSIEAEVARWSAKGWTVTSTTPTQAILQRPKKLKWLLHLILSVLTGGLWLIVVAILVINRKVETKVLRIDGTGRVVEA